MFSPEPQVVTARRTAALWARGFAYYLYLALTVVTIRVVFRVVFPTGIPRTNHFLFSLPHIPTPDWYAGIQHGGPVSLEAVLSSATDGLRLAWMLCCIGAANTLANPKRACACCPAHCTSWVSPSPSRSALPPTGAERAVGGAGPEAACRAYAGTAGAARHRRPRPGRRAGTRFTSPGVRWPSSVP